MTRYKSVNGNRIQFSPAEEVDRDAEEASWASEQAEIAAAKATRDLTRSEFIGMLAAKELDVIWSDMQAALKGVPGEEAAASRASLAANLHAKYYNLEATLALVGQFRAFAVKIDPDYAAMLTDDNITAAWRATVARSNGGTA